MKRLPRIFIALFILAPVQRVYAQVRLDSLQSIMQQEYCQPTEQLIGRLGKPVKVSYDTIANAYYGGFDSLVTLNYRDITIKLHHVCGDGRFLLNGVSIGDSSILLRVGFAKNMSRSSLENKLKLSYNLIKGKHPNEVILKYLINQADAEAYIQFIFLDDRLNEIEYLPWTD
jgi:hypothetical protein